MGIKATKIKFIKNVSDDSQNSMVYNFRIRKIFDLTFSVEPQKGQNGDIVLLYQNLKNETCLTHLVEIVDATVRHTKSKKYNFFMKVKVVGKFSHRKRKYNTSIADISFKGAGQGSSLVEIDNLQDIKNEKFTLSDVQNRILRLFKDEGKTV